ncbi:MAG: 50S ribosomal protein L24 [Candidatus Aminicenantes bacterium]|nr:50S ribosomal protein L24 [Candidatus Aminicenantes bacterium]
MAKPIIKKNDIVVVRRGRDRGKQGKVLKVIPETGRAIVEKINFVKEFIRPDRSKNVSGGIMEKEAPIALSNLMILCEDCGRGVRVRVKKLADGTKARLCARCQGSLDRVK